jgi:hypothetical protein
VKPPRVTLSILDASEPLRRRAPIYDENGAVLSDFMVIFPGLKTKPRLLIQEITQEIHRVLTGFNDTVVFAELNVAINLLWVSVRPVEGVRFEISEALRSRIPSARIVSHL